MLAQRAQLEFFYVDQVVRCFALAGKWQGTIQDGKLHGQWPRNLEREERQFEYSRDNFEV